MAAKRRADTALCQSETELQQLTLSQPPSTDAVDLEINGLMAQAATLGREVQAAEREVWPLLWRSQLVLIVTSHAARLHQCRLHSTACPVCDSAHDVQASNLARLPMLSWVCVPVLWHDVLCAAVHAACMLHVCREPPLYLGSQDFPAEAVL